MIAPMIMSATTACPALRAHHSVGLRRDLARQRHLLRAALILNPMPNGPSRSIVNAAFIAFDGDIDLARRLALLGLYTMIATSVWYGPPIKVQ